MSFILITFVILRIVLIAGFWKIFEKTGITPWKAIIPFYAEYLIITEIVGKPWFWIIYLVIPVLNVFAYYVLIFELMKCFGRRKLMDQFLIVFTGFIYVTYVAFQPSAKYLGKIDDLPQENKSAASEWTEAIAFAVVAATLIRWLIMEAYTIPTPSMENSLLVGDFLFVSKFHYGTRTPKTPLQIPLTHQKIWFTEIPSYLDWIQLPQYRLPGISEVKREDVVVFNVPPKELNEGKDYPVDLKTNYIKRCVAIPGDTIKIIARQVYVNGVAEPNPPRMQFAYLVTSTGEINERILNKYKIYKEDVGVADLSDKSITYRMFLTEDLAQELRTLPFITDVRIDERDGKNPEQSIFPPNTKLYPWNGDFYGPLVIPKRGMTIPINDSTLVAYGRTIRDYDHNEDAKMENGKLIIDGKEVTEYTFKQNYYFMMGDNRHNSYDSRYWGFVPEDHIVGKAFFIWLSIDKNADFVHKIRWNRFFKMIH